MRNLFIIMMIVMSNTMVFAQNYVVTKSTKTTKTMSEICDELKSHNKRTIKHRGIDFISGACYYVGGITVDKKFTADLFFHYVIKKTGDSLTVDFMDFKIMKPHHNTVFYKMETATPIMKQTSDSTLEKFMNELR